VLFIDAVVMAAHTSAWLDIMFYSSSFFIFRTPSSDVTGRNLNELCRMLGSDPYYKRNVQNVWIPSPKLLTGLPIYFQMVLRPRGDLSVGLGWARFNVPLDTF